MDTTEERLARLSVLQELTVSALDLFDPESAADPFLERVAERLGCLAALWLTTGPGGESALVAAAGLSEASRALTIPACATDGSAPPELTLPYPELARSGMTRWQFGFPESSAPRPLRVHSVLLFFDAQLRPPEEYLPAVERLVAVLRTVWTHRRLAEDLRKSYRELARTQLSLIERERLVAIGELSAVVAHEVRNPLAVIFNCIGTLEKHPSSPEQTGVLLRIMSEEANRLKEIVSELLDFARPGETVLECGSLAQIADGAITAVRKAEPQLQAGTVQISLEASRTVPTLLLDVRLVRSALVNLIGNAVQSMPSGGKVLVRVDEDELDGQPAARIAVTDQGTGVGPDIQPRIFEPFFTTKASGTGLGLAIVKRMVDAHRGDVKVRSDETGTTFIVRLPAGRILTPDET